MGSTYATCEISKSCTSHLLNPEVKRDKSSKCDRKEEHKIGASLKTTSWVDEGSAIDLAEFNFQKALDKVTQRRWEQVIWELYWQVWMIGLEIESKCGCKCASEEGHDWIVRPVGDAVAIGVTRPVARRRARIRNNMFFFFWGYPIDSIAQWAVAV